MEDIRLDRDQMQFLYESDNTFYFMNQETFEQIELTKEDLDTNTNFLEEEMIIDVLSYEGRPVGVELPTMVQRKVEYTEPGLKGDTTGRATKPAKIATGYELQVPLFVYIDVVIKIDTRNGEYVERVL